MQIQNAGAIPSLTEIEPPFNSILGPIEPRGRANGIILKEGRIAASWGDITRPDMTFSVAKSYLSILTGIAISDGLIEGVDKLVKCSVPEPLFDSDQNARITWRHLLHQTSEWEGTLFDNPDLIDRNRQVGPEADNTRKGTFRELQEPGSYWEYNDVRVNLLSLCLLHIFKTPLPEILKTRIMDPIGPQILGPGTDMKILSSKFLAISCNLYRAEHIGAEIHINTLDQARFGLMVHQRGSWKDRQLLNQNGLMHCGHHAQFGRIWLSLVA